VLDVPVPEVRLKGSCVMPLGGQREPAGVPQHVGVRLKAKPCFHARTLDHAREPSSRERYPAFRCEHEGRFRLLFPLEPPQHAQFVPEDRVCRGRSLLDPADVQGGRDEVHLIPAQVRQLARPEAMPIGHKDHGAITMAPSVALSGRKQPLDLGLRQVFAGAKFGVGPTSRCNCPFFGDRRDEPDVRFGHGFRLSAVKTVRTMLIFRTARGAASWPTAMTRRMVAASNRADR
jgi:hypothetical protein